MTSFDVNQLPREQQEGLARFRNVANSIVDSTSEPLRRTKPKTIYHYTSDAGLHGILQSGKLWLTGIFSLNDPSELRHGVGHAVRAVRRAAEATPNDAALQWFTTQLDQFLKGGIEESLNFFVACFSSDKDELGQWRAYGDDGRGYALGFDTASLVSGFDLESKKANAAYSSYVMNYDERSLARAQEELSTAVLPAIRAANQLPSLEQRRTYLRELGAMFSMAVLQVSSLSKHEAYIAEREFRFLNVHNADNQLERVKYRGRKHAFAPFVELDWKSSATDSLREIVIGPAAKEEQSFKFAKQCLELYYRSHNEVSVVRSGIPYRSA